jgi:hypothetical protein
MLVSTDGAPRIYLILPLGIYKLPFSSQGNNWHWNRGPLDPDYWSIYLVLLIVIIYVEGGHPASLSFPQYP